MYKQRVCALYASDEHLVTILIPYIYKQTEEERNIITIFEKDFRQISERILKIKPDNNKNLKIDWNKTNVNNLNAKLNKPLNKSIVIVAGENKFIEKVNYLLKNINEDFLTINCYNIFRNEKRISQIVEEYENILTTQGIEKMKKTITCII